MDPDNNYYVSIDKWDKRKDLWRAFPWPKNLLSPIRCLTNGHEEFCFNCYIGAISGQEWRYELIGPDTEENVLEKAKTYEFPS